MNTAKTVEAILNKDDKAVNHIIEQNTRLQKTIDEMKEELSEVKSEKQELEDENDGLNKSKTILQGYMKNIYELNKIEKQLKKNNETMYYNYKRMFYTLFINSIMFYILLMNVNNPMMQMASYIGYATIIITYAFYNYKNEQKMTAKNNQLIKNLNVLIKATDMVNDLFDSL